MLVGTSRVAGGPAIAHLRVRSMPVVCIYSLSGAKAVNPLFAVPLIAGVAPAVLSAVAWGALVLVVPAVSTYEVAAVPTPPAPFLHIESAELADPPNQALHAMSAALCSWRFAE